MFFPVLGTRLHAPPAWDYATSAEAASGRGRPRSFAGERASAAWAAKRDAGCSSAPCGGLTADPRGPRRQSSGTACSPSVQRAVGIARRHLRAPVCGVSQHTPAGGTADVPFRKLDRPSSQWTDLPQSWGRAKSGPRLRLSVHLDAGKRDVARTILRAFGMLRLLIDPSQPVFTKDDLRLAKRVNVRQDHAATQSMNARRSISPPD